MSHKSLSIYTSPYPVNNTLEFFTNSPQHKNTNIANFTFDVPLQRNWTNDIYSDEISSYYIHWHLISHLLISYGANKVENCKYMGIQSWHWWQYCQSNFVRLWKTRLTKCHRSLLSFFLSLSVSVCFYASSTWLSDASLRDSEAFIRPPPQPPPPPPPHHPKADKHLVAAVK